MIKVIQHGYEKYKTQCYNCKCVFEYELEDIEKGNVKCPDCGYECSHNSTYYLCGSAIKDVPNVCPRCNEPFLIRSDSITTSLSHLYKCTGCGARFTESELRGIITTAK